MNLLLIGTSFLSGMLTIIAPCVLPLLPIVIGSTATSQNKWKPVIVTVSLALSIVVFTLLLKASTLLFDIPQVFWTTLSGGIVLVFGLVLLFPGLWEHLANKLKLANYSQSQLAKAGQKESVWGGVLVGAALGPVFSSCSPTYFVILATVLPASFISGIFYLLVYAAGVAVMLGLIAYFGQRLIARLGWAADPRGIFRRIMGVLLVVVGILVMTGYEKKIETAILDAGFGVTRIEERLLDKTIEDMNIESKISKPVLQDLNADTQMQKKAVLPMFFNAPEFKGLENWINSEPINSVKDLRGKVVLIDFWTYSCINCIRTLPYIQSWYEKYADDGLVIIGIHAPEFQFERKLENVKDAVEEYGLTYPVVQDNDFKTWRAYNNRYWPAKYLIDQDGVVRYKHFGEGEYDETEEAIVELLDASVESGEVMAKSVDFSKIGTRETYVGLKRRANYVEDTKSLGKNQWTLTGDWEADAEKAVSKSVGAGIKMNFTASKANLVIGGTGTAKVYIDGELATSINSGKDVIDGILTIDMERLYELADFGSDYSEHEIEIVFDKVGVELFAWTFG